MSGGNAAPGLGSDTKLALSWVNAAAQGSVLQRRTFGSRVAVVFTFLCGTSAALALTGLSIMSATAPNAVVPAVVPAVLPAAMTLPAA